MDSCAPACFSPWPQAFPAKDLCSDCGLCRSATGVTSVTEAYQIYRAYSHTSAGDGPPTPPSHRTVLASAMDELSPFLAHERADVRAQAAEAVAAYSTTDDGVAALAAAADALLPGLVSLLGGAEAEAAGHAAAALVNICSSADGSAAAVGAGVFEAAVAQLDSGSAEVRERCTMLLANLTNPSLVDDAHLLRGGSLDSLLAAIFTASATERPSEGRVSEAAAHHCCRARATRIKRIARGGRSDSCLVAQAPATLEHLVSALCHVASTDSGRGELSRTICPSRPPDQRLVGGEHAPRGHLRKVRGCGASVGGMPGWDAREGAKSAAAGCEQPRRAPS